MSESILNSSTMPLAARMRPLDLDEVVGQAHLLAQGSPLRALAQASATSSLSHQSVILWGPPGTGKTTLAKALARTANKDFIELSAITAGVKEVREVMSTAQSKIDSGSQGTILFLDEIHRFSKAQQDALLPGVEAGLVTLVAASTENPSFSVIAPLLSRSLLLTLESLTAEEIRKIVNRAITDRRGLRSEFTLTEEGLTQIELLAQGDARRALTTLEAAARVCLESNRSQITVGDVSKALDHTPVRYDRDGDQHYDIISAFIKSVRGSDADAAIHWLARMLEGGEDPKFVARRLVILASEDIGLADPQALSIAVAAMDAVNFVGMPEGRIPLAEATIYLALAPKSNSAYLAINKAIEDVRHGFQPRVPGALRSSNYVGASASGNGIGYKYPHDDARAVVEQEYLPAKDSKRPYYVPKPFGFERELLERWKKLLTIIRGAKD